MAEAVTSVRLVGSNNRTLAADDRERITRARQAAEALFTPKRQVTEQSFSDPPSTDPSVRRPRVLGISRTAPVRHEELETAVAPELQPTRAIPRA
jgi:hypothetical protein